MVSVAMSKMGVAGLFFVEPGVKVNGKCYRDVLLSQQMLPDIRHVADDSFVFQQDSAPAHRARDTIELLQRETADFISPESYGPPTVRLERRWLHDLEDHAAACVRCRSTISMNSSSDWLTFGAVCSKALLTLLSASGESVGHSGVCSREGKTLQTSVVHVGCFNNGMKLSIDSFWSF